MQRRHSTPSLVPGWLMTYDQRNLYWKLVNQAAKIIGAKTSADTDSVRKLLHVRAFGRNLSAKEIDHLKMFDAIKAECLAIIQPVNLAAQMRQVNMNNTRLKHAIESAAPADYWQRICRDRFGTEDLDQLQEHQLVQLRNTLHARPVAHRRAPRVPVTVTPPVDPELVPF